MTPDDIRRFRESLGLSAEAFARAVGAASGRTVRRWEADPEEGVQARAAPPQIAVIADLAKHVPGVAERLVARSRRR